MTHPDMLPPDNQSTDESMESYIAECESKIERLNQQVAMLRKNLDLYTQEIAHELNVSFLQDIQAALSMTKPTAEAYDKQVRDAALEEAALFCDGKWDISGRLCASRIRAMKGGE